MSDRLELRIKNKAMYLLAERCIFFPENQTLVIADVHLGKAAHFRKAGIMIPQQAGTDQDFGMLQHVLDKYDAARIIFLGDLFHSSENEAWRHFVDFSDRHPHTELILIKGNHDVLPLAYYQQGNLTVHLETLQEDFILYSHAPLPAVPPGLLNIAGHVHPAARLKAKGKQTLRLPCFHLETSLLLLPAFGSLTGTFALPKGNAQQFVTTGRAVLAVK
ncbi:ligase-associated DNA damage response endonuclease PdeM [Olivibacter sp. CPCC 100613]|uniref:ligase-associated DNA damage response endonuclease PdeM n=1 Tax=Olivibacter sp. CPCC 100613 TaxID=3079931 RepID=UPI002FFAEF81